MNNLVTCINSKCKLKNNCKRSKINMINDQPSYFMLNADGTCSSQIKIKE